MKNWLNKWTKGGISAELDESGGLSPAARRRIDRSTDLQAFERETRILEQVLRAEMPSAAPPAGLHASILGAIQRTSRDSRRVALTWRWAAAGLMASLALAGWFLLYDSHTVPPAELRLVAAAQVLDLSAELETEVSSATLGPLTGELDRLNLDAGNAARFLLASLP